MQTLDDLRVQTIFFVDKATHIHRYGHNKKDAIVYYALAWVYYRQIENVEVMASIETLLRDKDLDLTKELFRTYLNKAFDAITKNHSQDDHYDAVNPRFNQYNEGIPREKYISPRNHSIISNN